ncbi:putative secreted protein [Granulibacter bethesdensis]|nr:putative secreted protein [Granulibacter bethesdensis]
MKKTSGRGAMRLFVSQRTGQAFICAPQRNRSGGWPVFYLLLKRRRRWPSALPPRGSIGCAQPRIMHGHP